MNRSFRTATGPLLLLALAMTSGFTAFGSFGTVQEGAKAELHLSDTTMALIQGVGAAVPLALFSVPIGLLVDRWNRVRLMIGLGSLCIVGTLLTAYAPGAPVLFAARMLAGIGASGALTAALSLAADLCSAETRGRALLIVNVGKMFGIAAAFALMGTLFGLFVDGGFGLAPWRAAHITLAAILLATLLPLFLLREPPRREVEAAVGAPLRVVLHEVWARRAFLIPLFVGQVGVVMADNASLVWAAPILQRDFGLRPDQFAGWMGALILGTGIGGAVLGGLAADRGQRSGRRGGVLVGAVLAAVVGTPMAVFPIAGDVTTFAILFGLLVLAGSVTSLITSVALTVLLPNEIRGLAIGLFIAVAGVIGFGIAPALVTGVSALLGGEGHLAAALSVVGVATGAAAAIAFLLAMRHAPVR